MSYKMEVKVQGTWSSNNMVYATEDEAKRAGRELLSRWILPSESRAVESEDKVCAVFSEDMDRPQLIEV